MNNQSLRICIFTQQYGISKSGIGTIAATMVSGLKTTGHCVTVVCPAEKNIPVDQSLEMVTFANQNVITSHPRWMFMAWKFKEIYRTILRKSPFDVLVFTETREAFFFSGNGAVPIIGFQNDYYFARPLWSLFEYPKMYGDWFPRVLYAFFQYFFDKAAIAKCRKILATSHATLTIIKKAYSLAESAGSVVHYGVQRVLGPAVPTPKISHDILFVGGNLQRKGLAVLIRAVGLVKRQIPDVRLNVVGQDKSLSRMKKLCRQLDIQNIVDFHGSKSNAELQGIIYNSSVYVLPSFIEGLGLSLLEAVVNGVPIIGSNTGGIPEIITDGVNGFLVSPGDYADLAEKIIITLTDDALRGTFIKNSLKILEKYSTETMISEIDAACREVSLDNNGFSA